MSTKATNEHTLSYINPSPPVPGLFFGYSDDGEEESKRKVCVETETGEQKVYDRIAGKDACR